MGALLGLFFFLFGIVGTLFVSSQIFFFFQGLLLGLDAGMIVASILALIPTIMTFGFVFSIMMWLTITLLALFGFGSLGILEMFKRR